MNPQNNSTDFSLRVSFTGFSLPSLSSSLLYNLDFLRILCPISIFISQFHFIFILSVSLSLSLSLPLCFPAFIFFPPPHIIRPSLSSLYFPYLFPFSLPLLFFFFTVSIYLLNLTFLSPINIHVYFFLEYFFFVLFKSN